MYQKSAVVTFIEEERAKGTADPEIRHHLLDAGWQMDIIQRAMDTAGAVPPGTPILEVKNQTTSYRRVFIAAGAVFILLVLLALFI